MFRSLHRKLVLILVLLNYLPAVMTRDVILQEKQVELYTSANIVANTMVSKQQELAEQGSIDIPTVAEKIFHEKPELKEEFTEKMEKYNLSEKQVTPQNPSTTKKFEKQYLTTDTGIEIKIPMEEYQNRNSVEFITNADGSISVLIKNIGSITCW